MISAHDKATVIALARRHGASRVWLFGSGANPRKSSCDLDLAVEGVAPARFFQFLGDLMLRLFKPMDLVALEKKSRLSALIRREGISIYGKPVREG